MGTARTKAPRRRSLIAFLIVFAAGLAAQLGGLTREADQRLLDAGFRLLREHAPRPLSNDVVLVGIDEGTLIALREPPALWHAHLGRFLKAMAAAKPAAVGLAVALPERSYDFIVPGSDQALIEGIAELRNRARVPLVLADSVDGPGRLRPIFAPLVAAAGGERAFASAELCLDPDLVVRRLEEDDCSNGPSLAGEMARYLGKGLRANGFIDYSIGDPVGYVPLQQVLQWAEGGQQARLAEAFGGRPVLLAAVVRTAQRRPLPVELASFEPRNRMLPMALAHVQALRSLLHGGLIEPLPAALALLAAVLPLLGWFGRSSWTKAALALVCGAALFVGSFWLLRNGDYLPAGSLVLALAFSALARLAYDIVYDAWRVEAGQPGARRRLCVMAFDVQGFVERAEKMPPEKAIALLNECFGALVSAVHRRGGTVSRLTGAAALAVFGAPQALDSPEKSALEAAQNVLEALRDVNVRLEAEGAAPLEATIGLHAGEVAFGQVGGRRRQDYTAVGDVVTVASQLQVLARTAAAEVGDPVLCSAAVADAVDRAGGLRGLGARTVAGEALELFAWTPPILAGEPEMKAA
jgi:class 3 adenylate cyclase/CHASE2 domain-containing sensor protein